MSSIGWLASMAAIVGSVWTLGASTAEAQAKQTVALSSAPSMRAAGTRIEDDRSESRDPTPMSGASIGVKVGMAGMGAGSYTLRMGGLDGSYTGHLSKRQGMQVAVPINLGGDGFGWTFEPFFARSSMAYDVTGLENQVLATEETTLTAYGLYMGPTYNVHVTRPLYLGTGLGLKTAYLKTRAFDYAADAYLRIPLNATYYVSDQLALVTEVGFGYGVSALVDKDVGVQGSSLQTAEKIGNDPKFGTAFAWDFSFGVRLP